MCISIVGSFACLNLLSLTIIYKLENQATFQNIFKTIPLDDCDYTKMKSSSCIFIIFITLIVIFCSKFTSFDQLSRHTINAKRFEKAQEFNNGFNTKYKEDIASGSFHVKSSRKMRFFNPCSQKSSIFRVIVAIYEVSKSAIFFQFNDYFWNMQKFD